MMRRLLSNRPSPAMVVACIALIVALGGTSYAALKLPRNSVGNKQLRPSAVTSGKVRNGSLTAKDFRSSALKRGPRGPQGPKGDSAPGAVPRVAFASRDPVAAGAGSIGVGAAPADLLGLRVPTGTSGYTASSGPVAVNGPSRLIANAQAVILNAGAATANVSCRIALITSDARPLGNYVNANIPGGNGYVPVAVSAGTDVEEGTYDVRVQCSSEVAGMSFHRGNLTVAVAPR
jgi:hypothetical protein